MTGEKTTLELPVSKLWTFSTVHMTQEDSKILSQVHELVVYEYKEGFWVLVPTRSEIADGYFWARLAACGVSNAVIHILKLAIRRSIDIVRFDADGPAYDFLPVFDW